MESLTEVHSPSPYTPTMVDNTSCSRATEDSPEVPGKNIIETVSDMTPRNKALMNLKKNRFISSEEDSDPEQAQKDKDMQKNLALIAKYKTDNQTGQFGNQRAVNVVGARETVGGPVVQQSGIQCFNCKEFGHYAKECRKPKRVRDSTYHKEKMFCVNKRESYMAKIQEVPNADSGTDAEPLEQVHYDTDHNVFANDLQHFEQSESIRNTCAVETGDSNVIPDSPDMCDNDIQDDQNDVECDNERAALANLIANLKLDVDDNKKIQKQLKKANATLTQELTECKSILAETSRTLGESNSIRDSCLVALQNKQTEFERYKAFNDRTVDYDKLERKLNETLGLLAQKDIDIQEGLKVKAYEISVVQAKHDELVKQGLSTRESVEKVENNKQAKYLRKNSFNHLIKDCDFYEKKMVKKPVWNNASRVNHQNSQRLTHPHPKGNFVPKAVLMKSGHKTLNTARQNSSKAVVSVNTARPINTAYLRPTVNSARTISNVFNRAHSRVRRPFNKFTTKKNSNLNENVNTIRRNVTTVGSKAVVSDNKGNEANAIKASACWVWRPKQKVLDHVSRHNGASMNFKRFDYVDAQGKSKHMTGNKSYLSNYEEINGGFVAFGGSTKGGKITSKGKIKTGKLDFEDAYFVKELKFNHFSVSQMCDKKNSVLFTDTECVILSPDFKLLDENQVLLRVPKKYNMYSVDLQNVVPSGGLTCLFIKATLDESNLWHRRLGHINFKTMNKLVNRNLDETSGILKAFITGIENQINHRVIIISCDNGTEFKNKEMNQFYEMKGIKREFSVARTPQQNGVAERKNRTLIEAARTMLADSKLPTTFWDEVVNTACYVQNKVLVIKHHNKTSYKLFLGRKPALSFMRPFGCLVTILNTLDHLGSRSEWLFDIDTLTKSINYKLVVEGNQTNGNAGTKESIDAGQAKKKTIPSHEYILLPLCTQNPPFSSSSKDSPDVGFKPLGEEEKKDAEDQKDENSEVPNTEEPRVNQEKDENVYSTNIINTVSSTVNTASIMDNVDDENTVYGCTDDPNMPNLEEIIYSKDEEGVGAKADMNNLDAFMPVTPIPTIRIHKDHPFEQIIRDLHSAPQTKRMTKSVTEHAQKGNPGIKRSKLDRSYARRASAVQVTIDYDEVFAPVARIEAIRLLLSYALFKYFVVYQMDVKSAFLYGKIEEEVYVCQPLGFEDLEFPDRVYKVEKELYGLHQAPRAWFETLSTYLLYNGFQRGIIDKTLFIKKVKGDILLVQVYVDDIIFGSTKKSLCTDQDKYVDEILKKFGFSTIKTSSTPIETSKPLMKDENVEDVNAGLGIVVVVVVCACTRFQVTPKVSHLHAMKRIFRYLKGQPKLGLWYLKDSPFDLEAYTDSDYAGASLDRKSTIGSCQFLGSKLILWQCKKQIVVANFTNEAEDSYEKRLIQVIKIYNDYNVADLLTKAFDVSRFQYLIATANDGIKVSGVGLTYYWPTEISQSSGPTTLVADETVYEERGDSMERAATTAASLDAQQDNGTDIKEMDKNKGKADKTEHGNEKSARKRIQRFPRILMGQPFPEIHHPPQATDTELLQARENLMEIIQAFLKEYDHIPPEEKCMALLLAEERFLKNKKKPKVITPDLPTVEPDNSLIMGDEHLDTVSETESNEVIKSSVEILVPIPSEFKGIFDDTCDVPVCEDPSTFDALSNHSEILSDSNDDDTSSDDDDFEDIEYVSLEEVNNDQEEKEFDLEDILQIQDIILHEKLLNISRLITNIESLNDKPTPDRVLKSPSLVPISATDSTDIKEMDKNKGKADKTEHGNGKSARKRIQRYDQDINVTIANAPINTAGVSVSTAKPSTPPTTTTLIEDEDLTVAQTLMKMRKPSESGTRKAVPPSQHDLKDKGKAKMIELEKPLKKKDHIMFDEEVAKRLAEELEAELEEEERDSEVVEGSEKKIESSRKETISKKRAGEGLDEESVKRQKLEDDAEKAELQLCLEIVPRDDEVVNVESLSTKYPIVDWKTHILAEDKIHDVLDLYRLVKERFETASPERYDRLLWGDLITLFKPSEKDEI
ncbi:putative ribonuclease H-like domain-containing protein [Tanacetum coccineum]|uniref:Ribonuclease H-like domain-containing protein n=1 Tax=Tanacetum coccineum TaxID=301880 RepID=A0ABQ5EYN3_9ASTR